MLSNILICVAMVEVISHFLGYTQSATVTMVRLVVTRVHDLVQAMLPKGK
jgi:hypothetical protein